MTQSLRYPGDEQSRQEQLEREEVRHAQHLAEEAERVRIYNATPRPPDWWNEATAALRRGIVFAMRADGATFPEIAGQLNLSTTRIHDIFHQSERRIWWAADVRFNARRDWMDYEVPSSPAADPYWNRRFMERQ